MDFYGDAPFDDKKRQMRRPVTQRPALEAFQAASKAKKQLTPWRPPYQLELWGRG